MANHQVARNLACTDPDTGEILHRADAPHPDGTEVAPEAWWDALGVAGAGLLEQVDVGSIAGQQHGLVALDRRQIRHGRGWPS